MAFQPAPDTIQIVHHALQNGVPVVNVFNVRAETGITDAALTLAANTYWTWWVANMRANQHTSYVTQDVTATDISIEGGHQYVFVPTTDQAGTSAAEPLSGQAAAVVSWRTARIGRSYRGRTYMGGGTVGWTVDAQHLDTTFTAGLATIMNSLLSALNAANFTLVVVSRFLNNAERVVAVLTNITSFIIDTVVDTQRRRTAN